MDTGIKNAIKNILKSAAIFLPVLAGIIFIFGPAMGHAAQYIPLPGSLCGEGGFPCPEPGTGGVEAARSLAGRIVDNIRYIVGAVAVVMIIVSAVKLITAG